MLSYSLSGRIRPRLRVLAAAAAAAAAVGAPLPSPAAAAAALVRRLGWALRQTDAAFARRFGPPLP
jgi:ABC-type sugar transport system substrate-binding protein